MNCPCCGVPVKEGMPFCPSCGTNMNISGSAPQKNVNPGKSKPLGPWAYVGYGILFAIPVVGFIFLIIFSINGSNLNRRNYARSYWCALLLVVILIIAAMIALIASGEMGSVAAAFERLFDLLRTEDAAEAFDAIRNAIYPS